MDFKNALNAGLYAAKKARSNKDEILGVIKELSQSINDFSEGLVTLEITNERKMVGNHNVFTAAVGALGALSNVNPFKDYQALSFVRKSEGQSQKKIIADWSLDEADGYPCVISYDKQDVRCTTKETLVKALNGLVSNAMTGEALLELMEHKNEK